MAFKYTAKVYIDADEVSQEGGDDIDKLYNWMLAKAQGQFGNFNGEIIENKTGKVVKCFRKAPSD